MEIPKEVEDLKSFLELISWAMEVFADHDGPGSMKVVKPFDTGRSKGFGAVKPTYGGHPTHVHAQWFVRMGAAGETNPENVRSPKTTSKIYGAGGVVTDRWLCGRDLSKGFTEFCDAVIVPRPVEAYLRERFVDLRRDHDHFPADFSAARVRAAVQASSSLPRGRENVPASGSLIHPPTPVLKAGRNEAAARRTVQAASTSAAAVTLIAPDGRELMPAWHADRLLLTDASQGSPTEGVLVDSRGRLVASEIDSRLFIGDVNRITATISPWSRPVGLATLGGGSVLAVGCAGQYGALFVLSDTASTWLCNATPDGNAQRLVQLAATASRAAVLHGAYALLGTAREDGDAVECTRFPGLDVEWLRFAAAGGHSLLIAGGRSHSGDEGTWLSLDGASPRSGPEACALKLPLSGHEPPSLTNSEIEWASTASLISFDHWFHPNHGSRLRTA